MQAQREAPNGVVSTAACFLVAAPALASGDGTAVAKVWSVSLLPALVPCMAITPWPMVQFDWLSYPDVASLAEYMEGDAIGYGTLARKMLSLLLEIDIRRLGTRMAGTQGAWWKDEQAAIEACQKWRVCSQWGDGNGKVWSKYCNSCCC